MIASKEKPRAGQATGNLSYYLNDSETRSGSQGSIDVGRLENVTSNAGKIIAACPACRESGNDTQGNHLFVAPDGRFGCVMFPDRDGIAHRRRIFEMVGMKTTRPQKSGEKKKKLHATLDKCAEASKWGLEQNTKYKWKETRRDLYHDAAGEVVAAVLRFDRADGAVDKYGKAEKQFRPVHRHGKGWMTGDPSGKWPLYRLHLIGAEDPVFICEGEKAAAAGAAIGLNCTTSAHGAKSPHKSDWGSLAGRDVVILRDNDSAGLKYARCVTEIVAMLNPPARVKVIKLPGLPPKGDLVDYINLHPGEDIASVIRKLVCDEPSESVESEPPEPEEDAESDDPSDSYSDDVQQIIGIHGPPFLSTENGIALQEPFWAALYADENIILHEPGEHTFYLYHADRGLFVEHTPERIKTEIAARIFQASSEWKRDALLRHRGNNLMNNIVSHLRGQTEVRDAFSKRECRFVHLQNGIIVFRDDDADFVGFSSTFRSRNQSPISYKEGATCNRFLDELLYPAVHEEDVSLIQKFAGLFLLGENIIQRFLILDGMPGGGKGQLSIVLQSLVGFVNCTQLRTEHLSERFELFRFLRKTLLYGADVPADFLNTKGASLIKSLVGGDLLDAERKGGNGSHLVEGRFNILLTSNSRLRVKLEGDVGAWRRRTTIVRYENPPPKKRIPDFGKLLMRTEGEGILNWALAGLRDLLEDVAETGDVKLTNRQRGITESLMAESDSVRIFLMERVEGAQGHSLTVNAIIKEYAAYCPSKGWNPLPITVIQRQLEGLMLELFHVVKSNSCGEGENERGFRGVKFSGEFLL